ncbi:hypothetical protein, partial [Enterobacter cloacae complex sp. 2DZ2F20B]|uniref:hypothetical protein n=1 Tax=Enterobacter cloacae complex sp. 2DZ2F20B TaxID=2511993 RepID=UPI0010274086
LYVPFIKDCLNNVPNSSTGYAATQIVNGEENPSTLNAVIHKYINTDNTNKLTLEQVKNLVYQQLQKMALQRRNKQRCKTYKIDIGDLVLLKTNP